MIAEVIAAVVGTSLAGLWIMRFVEKAGGE